VVVVFTAPARSHDDRVVVVVYFFTVVGVGVGVARDTGDDVSLDDARRLGYALSSCMLLRSSRSDCSAFFEKLQVPWNHFVRVFAF
jgi:hypothetical protein